MLCPIKPAVSHQGILRKKKPVRARLIKYASRDGIAIIEYADPEISVARLTIGPQIKTMTDSDIVGAFNGIMDAQDKLLSGWNKTVIEVQPGEQ
jgi:hypothetical protein